MKMRAFFAAGAAAALCAAVAMNASAAKLTLVSDLISTSALGASANHTIKFTTVTAVPASGRVVIAFPSELVFPPALGIEDIDFEHSTSSGATYMHRQLAAAPSATEDGVTITSVSTSTIVIITLSPSSGIGAGDYMRVRIGTHAEEGAAGADQIVNPSVRRHYIIPIETQTVLGAQIDENISAIYIIEQVGVGPADTTDIEPPVLSNGAPTGLLPGGTVAVELTLSTNEIALCRYATTTNVLYDDMTASFGTSYERDHRATISGLLDSSTSTFYVRCRDFQGNKNTSDYPIIFSIGVTPTDPNAVLNPNPNPNPNSNPNTSTNTNSNSNSSGSGGGGPRGGDYLPGAEIVIAGYAPPGAAVTVLKDGAVWRTENAGGDGAFSSTIDEIDRGIYTVSAYATDSRGLKTRTFSATVTIRSATVTSITGVLLAPTIGLPTGTVSPGSPVAVSGATPPLARVLLSLRPEGSRSPSRERSATTTAAGNGSYQASFDTAGLPSGVYDVVARSIMPSVGLESDEGIAKLGLGVSLAPAAAGANGNPSDLNQDGKVNLVDFSILLFNWNTSNATADINKDSIVNLTDFSIMIFNWTG